MLLLLLLLLHDRCHRYSYSYSYSSNKQRHSTDGDTTISMYTFRWASPAIFNTHTILLTKSISSLSNWKSNSYEKKDGQIRTWKIKTITMMMMTQQRRQRRLRQRLQYSIHTCWSYTILLTTVHTHKSVWFDLIWFDSIRSVWLY